MISNLADFDKKINKIHNTREKINNSLYQNYIKFSNMENETSKNYNDYFENKKKNNKLKKNNIDILIKYLETIDNLSTTNDIKELKELKKTFN